MPLSVVVAMSVLAWPLVASAEGGWNNTYRVTGYADSAVSGDAEHGVQFSGRLEALLSYKEPWEGATLNAHLEYVDGDEFTGVGAGGVLWPTNVYAAVPRATGSSNGTVSFTLVQQFTPATRAAFGKFNVVEMARGTPIAGGKGKGGFLYTGLAAPPSLVFPPYVFGGQLVHSTPSIDYSLMVYDPNNAQGSDFWRDLFEDGVVFNGTATYKTSISGKPGYYGVNYIHSTAKGTDYDSLLLPPDVDGFARQTKGVSFAALKFQQFLGYSADSPQEGWGVFGQLGFGDGNPNQLDNAFLFGVAGTVLAENRGLDRWGIGWARYYWSDALIAALEAEGGGLRDESAIEAFYEAALNETVRLGANVMQVKPGLPGYSRHLQVGTRVSFTF